MFCINLGFNPGIVFPDTLFFEIYHSWYNSFKGGDPVEFRLINEAYKGLISHITKLEIIEEESKLSNESVIIEVRFLMYFK